MSLGMVGAPIFLIPQDYEVYTVDGQKLAYDDTTQTMNCKTQTTNYTDRPPLTPKGFADTLQGLSFSRIS